MRVASFEPGFRPAPGLLPPYPTLSPILIVFQVFERSKNNIRAPTLRVFYTPPRLCAALHTAAEGHTLQSARSNTRPDAVMACSGPIARTASPRWNQISPPSPSRGTSSRSLDGHWDCSASFRHTPVYGRSPPI